MLTHIKNVIYNNVSYSNRLNFSNINLPFYQFLTLNIRRVVVETSFCGFPMVYTNFTRLIDFIIHLDAQHQRLPLPLTTSVDCHVNLLYHVCPKNSEECRMNLVLGAFTCMLNHA